MSLYVLEFVEVTFICFENLENYIVQRLYKIL
jgi:hypothetical protein